MNPLAASLVFDSNGLGRRKECVAQLLSAAAEIYPTQLAEASFALALQTGNEIP